MLPMFIYLRLNAAHFCCGIVEPTRNAFCQLIGIRPSIPPNTAPTILPQNTRYATSYRFSWWSFEFGVTRPKFFPSIHPQAPWDSTFQNFREEVSLRDENFRRRLLMREGWQRTMNQFFLKIDMLLRIVPLVWVRFWIQRDPNFVPSIHPEARWVSTFQNFRHEVSPRDQNFRLGLLMREGT